MDMIACADEQKKNSKKEIGMALDSGPFFAARCGAALMARQT